MSRDNLLQYLEANQTSVQMSLTEPGWLDEVPAAPGWYWILTSAPLDALASVEKPKSGRHYCLPSKLAAMEPLRRLGLTVEPDREQPYVVYSGHAKALKARAREHYGGHPKTGCLALRQYETLRAHRWEFRFATVPPWASSTKGSGAVRAVGEQLWRAHHGWPLLCSQ